MSLANKNSFLKYPVLLILFLIYYFYISEHSVNFCIAE